MKKGFTLLELIIVIIIIGVLATLGFVQYSRMIEKARGAEARALLGNMRTLAGTIYMENNSNCTNCINAGLGVGSTVPGPAAANCDTSHYFWYNVTASGANGFTALATRCTALGKTPNGTAPAGTLQLVTNFTAAGSDVWTATGGY